MVSAQTIKCHLFMNLFQQMLAVFFFNHETGSGKEYQVPLSEGFGPSVGQESQSNFVHELFMNCSCNVHNPTEAWLSRPERKTTKRRMRGKQLEAKDKDRDSEEQEDRTIWATIAN